MSVTEKTHRALKDFALTEYEIKAYVALVEAGPLAASELSRAAGVPYSKIYEILGNLERKGWVESEQGRPSKYYAKAPSTALESSRMRVETTLKASRREALRKIMGLADVRVREQMFGGGIISDSNQIILLLVEEPERGLTLAISSDHLGLVKFGKNYFEYLWENSKPVA